MKGWNIFVHSVQQVLGNFGAALKVSGVLYLAQILVALLFDVSLFMNDGQSTAALMQSGIPWFWLVIAILVSVITSLWIAVAWHRYILLEEEPGIIPEFRGDRILSYFKTAVLIFLILIIPAMILIFISGAIAIPYGQNGGSTFVAEMIVTVIVLPLTVIGFRLSTILPGVALGKRGAISDGWQATSGETGDFVVLSVAWSALLFVLGLVMGALGSAIPALTILFELVVGWVTMMIGISILTTLYGHYIEKRPLL
jgi:hypothetical protein